MSTETEPRNPLLRFLDAFLSEENIRWMLGLGVLLLLGSSIRLVTVHWHDYTPVWKYVILLAYTAAIFACSQLAQYRLGLRKTGSVLMGLTVLLIPLNFLALHWVQPAGDNAWIEHANRLVWMGLVAFTFVLSSVAAGRIFQHWFRIPQRTFLVSYLALSVAGAIVPVLPTQWSTATAIVLWLIFTAGTLKVNRHVFWLIEEHRQPRIFGFLPIALLGGMFVGLFVLLVAPHLAIGWLGLACALSAVTVLATADAAVAVHQQRTGKLSRPYPWPVVLPLVTGSMLCLAGLCLAASGWPRPLAMVPTAAAAMVGLMLVGRRLENRAFVWAALVASLLAYQFSPVYFQSLAAQVVRQGAAAVHEPRLPLAFYGITYLPFIAGITIASVALRRRGALALSRPMQHFAVALTCGLQVLALTHQKAQLPVSLILLAVFVLQACVFRARWLTAAAGVSWLVAAYGAVSFAGYAFDWVLTDQATVLVLALAAGALLQPGTLLDRLSLRLTHRNRHSELARPTYPLRTLGAATLLALAGIWLLMLPWQHGPLTLTVSLVIGSLLAAHAMTGPKALLGAGTLLFATIAVLIHGFHAGMQPMDLLNLLEGMLLGQWLLGSALDVFPMLRIARAFREPAKIISLIGLSLLFVLRVLPALVLAHTTAQFDLLPNLLMSVWMIDAARRERLFMHSLLGFFGLLLMASAVWMHHSADADPTAVLLIWAVVATAALPLRHWLDAAARRNNRTDPLATALRIGIPLVLFGVTTCGLAFIAWPARLGALIALAGVWHLARRSESPAYRAAFVGLFNGNLLTTVVAAMASSGPYITSVTGAEMAHISLALAAVTALELFVIEWSVIRRWLLHDMLAHAQTVVLWALLVALLMCPLQQLHAGLTLSQAAFAALAFVLGSAKLISYSYRSQRTEGTWGGLLMLVAGGCYFAAFGLLDVRTEWALYVPLVASCVLWTVGRMLSNRTGMQVIAAPLQHTARWLPLLVPAIAVSRHVVDPLPVWRGSSSLALFASAGFYFWVGVETHQKRYVLLAGTIVNIALALLWRELGWHDPQLFMVPIGASLLLVVEWLKPEIPAPYRDPLRYVGALVILVSPTFDILGGSWLHLCSLMVLSVLVALVAMGLRVRALLYAGTAFLAADIVAMVVRGGIDRPNLLWITGMLLGGGIVALAAFCENHREALLARVRAVAATLEAWE